MDVGERLVFILTAVHAVAPDVVASVPPGAPVTNAEQLLRWAARADPVAASLLDRLAEDQRRDVRRVLEGMLRDRVLSGSGPG